jgi:hypothetical protein
MRFESGEILTKIAKIAERGNEEREGQRGFSPRMDTDEHGFLNRRE